MKLYFCTLFNSNYLSRGMSMYQSLVDCCDEFHLFVFAFDDGCFQFLKSQKFDHITIISLVDFEDKDLLNIKASRTSSEYCWTCTPSIILYCLKKFNIDHCTYVDADLIFFSNPIVLIKEMNEASISLSEHRFSKEHDLYLKYGKYCVQFMTFKNEENALIALEWWRKSCNEWCYARLEEGRFGDQKYLDDWIHRFKGVHEIKNIGAGIAPWNVQQYSFKFENDNLTGFDGISGVHFSVIFFHFHGLTFFENNIVSLTNYEYFINEEVKSLFYYPYIKLLNNKKQFIQSINASINSHGSVGKSKIGTMNIFVMFYYYFMDLKRSIVNIFGKTLKYRRSHHYFYCVDDIINN